MLEGFENADLSVRIRCFISRQLESGVSWRDAFTCGLARDVTPESALAECGFGAPGGSGGFSQPALPHMSSRGPIFTWTVNNLTDPL